MERLHVLLHDEFKFYWNIELETLFQQFKSSITKVVTLTLKQTILSSLLYIFS